MKSAKPITTKKNFLKIFICLIAALSLIFTLIAWFNSRQNGNEFKAKEISAYKKLDLLVAKIITTTDPDSLVNYTKIFNRALFEAQTSSFQDSVISLSMRRFTFELNDKLHGIVNLLDSGRFERTGQSIIRTCAAHISSLPAN